MSYYTLPSFNYNSIELDNFNINNISQTLVYYVNQCFNDLVNNKYYDFGKKYVYMYSLLKESFHDKLNINFFCMIEINTITNIVNNKSEILVVDDDKNIINNLIKYTTNFNKINCFYYDKNLIENKFSVIFHNESINKKTKFIHLLNIIKKHQKVKGNISVKLDNTHDNYSINIIYILSLLYKKIVVIKPNSGNVFLFERYIICKSFNKNSAIFIDKICSSLINDESENISIKNIPLFFLNKLDECNTIMGQQQLDCILFMHQCNFLKEKYEKLENIYKKLNYKTIQWIENNNLNYTVCKKITNEDIINENIELQNIIDDVINNVINENTK